MEEMEILELKTLVFGMTPNKLYLL